MFDREDSIELIRRINEVLSNSHGINFNDENVIDLFFMAIEQGITEHIDNFFDKGFNPNTKNEFSESALHVAISNGDARTLQVLLNHPDINPNIENLFGDTPLHEAVKKSNMYSAGKLLNHPKIDPNSQNQDGNTPLHNRCYTR